QLEEAAISAAGSSLPPSSQLASPADSPMVSAAGESISRLAIPEEMQTEGVRLTVPVVPTDSDSGRPLPPPLPTPPPAAAPTMPMPTVVPTSPAPVEVPALPAHVGVHTQAQASSSVSGNLGGITGSGSRGVLGLVGSPLVRKMLESVLEQPLVLSPDERY